MTTPQTFVAGQSVRVSVPSYSPRKGDVIRTMTVVRVTPTGALRLSDGELYRFDGTAYVRWCTLVMGLQSTATLLGLA